MHCYLNIRAVSMGLVENVRILIERGKADTSLTGKDGLTAFEMIHKKITSSNNNNTNNNNNSNNNYLQLVHMLALLAKVRISYYGYSIPEYIGVRTSIPYLSISS